MLNLTEKQIIEYFKKSYTSADGLWFMKAEGRYDFDTALDMDVGVWKVMPKIQARMLKPLAHSGSGLIDLMECLATKLMLEGYSFDIVDNTDSDSFSIKIGSCPWHNLMLKSKREHLAGKIGSVVCVNEYEVWAKEFGDNIDFKLAGQICNGDGTCIMDFKSTGIKQI
jgi:hypothetical protein